MEHVYLLKLAVWLALVAALGFGFALRERRLLSKRALGAEDDLVRGPHATPESRPDVPSIHRS